MKTVIIEDEEIARTALIDEIQTFCPHLQIVGMATNVKDAVSSINTLLPEVVFMDVNLIDGTGFDVLSQVESLNFNLIFTTAYSDYALQAIKFSALDYLLKPIDGYELRKAVDQIPKERKEDVLRKIETFLYNSNQNKPQKRVKIALHVSSGVEIIEVKNIVRCTSEGNYTKFFFTDRKPLLISKTLKEFESLLRQYDFIRPHASHLISLDHVLRYDNSDGGYLVLSDKSIIPVSKRRKNELLEILANWN
ncbi:MAG: LytTR family DNA-binding domain-containing protein [Crocinitomicaceae bacterium]